MFRFVATFAALLLVSEARELRQEPCPNNSWDFTKCSSKYSHALKSHIYSQILHAR